MSTVFAERLRRELDSYGKAAELSRDLGVDRSTISGYQSGRSRPNIDDFFDLCRKLGASPNYLLGWWDEEVLEPEVASIAEQLARDFAADLRSAIDRTIADEVQRFVAKLREGQAMSAEDAAELRRSLEPDSDPEPDPPKPAHAAPRKRKPKKGG